MDAFVAFGRPQGTTIVYGPAQPKECVVRPQCLSWQRSNASGSKDSDGFRCCNSGRKVDFRHGRQKWTMALAGAGARSAQEHGNRRHKHKGVFLTNTNPRKDRNHNVHSLVLRMFLTLHSCWRCLHESRTKPSPAGGRSLFQVRHYIRPKVSNGVRCCDSGEKVFARQKRKGRTASASEKCTATAATNTKESAPRLGKPHETATPTSIRWCYDCCGMSRSWGRCLR